MSRRAHGHEIEARLPLVQALRPASGVGAAPVIEGHLKRGQSLVEETGARTPLPRVYTEQAELARLRADDVTCERELREARRVFEEVDAVNLAERVALSVASI